MYEHDGLTWRDEAEYWAATTVGRIWDARLQQPGEAIREIERRIAAVPDRHLRAVLDEMGRKVWFDNLWSRSIDVRSQV